MSDIFSSMLTGWQWLLLCLIPPAIVALYFLKLRRQPLEVPSTYLWRRTIEDMHVNSLWQRLRQNLLLVLQLLLIGLLMLACLRPSWRGRTPLQDRLVFLVDTSASMTATDVGTSRLELAKRKVDDLIEQMDPGDAAMLISFSDRARVEQPFTTSKRLLRQRLAAVEATERTSDIGEALRVAAGLANPGRSGDAAAGDVAAADAMPADVFVLSDGGFRSIPEFSWGNLRPIYVPIGRANARNMAVIACSAQVNPARPDRMEAFVQVQNFSEEEAQLRLELSLDGALLDAAEVTVAVDQTVGTSFSFDRVEEGTLQVAIEQPDDLLADNTAYVAINRARRARLLLVTPGNDALELALGTDSALRLADASLLEPEGLNSTEYQQAAAAGEYDLVIYDQCQPKEMPNSNTLFVGTAPPGEAWKLRSELVSPQILDVELAHPLMKYLTFGDVRFVRAQPVEGPLGAQVLIDSDGGPLIMIAPRAGFEDVVMGFELVRQDDKGDTIPNTDWPIRSSFPLFCKNILEYLAGAGRSREMISVLPGTAVPLRIDGGGASVKIIPPSGDALTVGRDRNNAYVFDETDEVGVYQVVAQGQNVAQRFSVNLFDPVESRLPPQPAFETAWNKIEAQDSFETTRRDAWRWILIVAVAVLVVEWYIYNRRVYL